MVNKDSIKWFNNEEENQMVKFTEIEGECEFCGSTKGVCEIKVNVPDDFENVDTRGQKANLIMCDNCMNKFAQAFIEKKSNKKQKFVSYMRFGKKDQIK